MSGAKFSPGEIADVLAEALDELGTARQAKVDWVIEALEKQERDEKETHKRYFQRIRAELFRRGVKHSNQL